MTVMRAKAIGGAAFPGVPETEIMSVGDAGSVRPGRSSALSVAAGSDIVAASADTARGVAGNDSIVEVGAGVGVGVGVGVSMTVVAYI